MKKIVLILILVSVLGAFACGQKQKDSASEGNHDESTAMPHEYPSQCVPPWELAMPVSKDGIYGKGQADSEKGLAQNRDLADRRARDSIGAKLENKTPDILATFIQRNSSGSTTGLSDFVIELSCNTLMQPLKGSYVAERYMCPDGTVYSLAFFPFANFSEEIAHSGMKEAKISTKNKKFYDVFTSKRNIKSLERLLRREFVE